ncbi:MAG: ABC transporter permease [Bacteroidales bacterium]|jgi:putative ABC transport system permease protein|nr:ABC transporter permease [Bacteroidales bacterium]
MSTIQDISWVHLAISFCILLIPFAGFWYYRVGLTRSTIIAIARMTVQLSAVAVYLEFIFEKNNAFLNLAWVMIMILVGVFTTLKRSNLNAKQLALPLIISGLTSLIIVDAFFLGIVIKLPYLFESQYFIPISGMILGNAMNHNIVGLNAYFEGLVNNQNLYYFLLLNGKSKKAAVSPFIVKAIRKALNPMIANTSVMGLISLPGMMTGQILGGNSPATAIRYQIMIMLAIFTGCSINLMLSIIIANKKAFDKMDRIAVDVLTKNND